jgi:cyanate permease
MRILLDESLPRHRAAEFPAHEVHTVRQMDQQDLGRFNIAVVVLVAMNKRIESLRPPVPSVEELLKEIKADALRRVSA